MDKNPQNMLVRPEPIRAPTLSQIDRHDTIEALLRGEQVLLTESFQRGLELLSALSTRLGKPSAQAPYQQRKNFEKRFRTASLGLLVRIQNHQSIVEGSSDCGFFAELYPEQTDFFLPFPQLQELSGAWKQYQQGVHFPVLGHRLHPFYGTYYPKRSSHLELFATWLHRYQGSKERAIDMGAGSGVLSFLLEKRDFQSILAVDHNPNSVESIIRECHRHQYRNIRPLLSNLFQTVKEDADLIVFNPPWILGEPNSLVDQALFSGADLLERFFEQAQHHLRPEGTLLLVYSNIQTLLFPKQPHPIEEELRKGRFSLIQKLQRKVKPAVRDNQKKRRTKERVEIWELKKK